MRCVVFGAELLEVTMLIDSPPVSKSVSACWNRQCGCYGTRISAVLRVYHVHNAYNCSKECEYPKVLSWFWGMYCRTVEEMLFGYEDELLADLATIVPSLYKKSRFQLMPNMTSVEDALKLPKTIMDTAPVDPASHMQNLFSFRKDEEPKFKPLNPAWLPEVPNSMTVAFRHLVSKVKGLFTGWEDWAKEDATGWSYKEWQGLSEMTCWGEGHVESVLGGSDALQFTPGLTPDDSVYIFVPELFRMAKLNVTGTVRLCSSHYTSQT